MCGIVAVVGDAADRDRVGRMANAVQHRGPDDQGIWTGPGVALGHRRLSIIDLSSAGHQPMTSHDGRYTMVFNGEIYNYIELAAEFPDIAWRGHSDSEVLLEGFARTGPAIVDKLVGMFAFAIWDQLTSRLFCARDRLGIKPLYLSRLRDAWLVGSEIGALLAGGVRARPDEAVIYDFLARDFYEHGDSTFFADIRKLPPASWAWLEAGSDPEITTYWSLASDAERLILPASRNDRGELLLELMQDSVQLALRSDVRVGVALSGGLDSAVLLGLIDRVQPNKIAAFSFEFAEEAYSERPWVEQMARHTGHPAAFRRITASEFARDASLVSLQQQEPHAGAPVVAYTACFEMIRNDGVIVVMDGSGIDEGLGGYARFAPARWADLQGDALAQELAASKTSMADARPRMISAANPVGDIGKGQDLTSSVRPECVLLAASPLPTFERPFPDVLRNLMYRELRYTKLPRALRFRDRLSMAYGCELRPPFLDHRLLAHMFALPGDDLIRDGGSKVLLREAAARLLPDSVRLASKRSVQTPQREWFRGELATWVRDQIDTPSFWARGWVDRNKALDALARFQAGEGDNSFFAWQWIALEQWARAFL
ncbi:MAG TPA: asparagine synthase (glutamine-hydrolyzing) [Kofleriaceae bacterium]